jgi:hypothetical protein
MRPKSAVKRSPRKKSPVTRKRSSARKISKRKSSVRIPVTNKGSLSKHGWSSSKPATKRHAALKKAMKDFTPGMLVKKLNLLVIYNKNKNPKLSKLAHSDMKFVQTFE